MQRPEATVQLPQGPGSWLAVAVLAHPSAHAVIAVAVAVVGVAVVLFL